MACVFSSDTINNLDYLVSTNMMIIHVEKGSNISIATLRATEGDEKWTWCLGYNWTTLSLKGHKYRDLVLQVGNWAQVDDLVL
jgi:hypothetical protein